MQQNSHTNKYLNVMKTVAIYPKLTSFWTAICRWIQRYILLGIPGFSWRFILHPSTKPDCAKAGRRSLRTFFQDLMLMWFPEFTLIFLYSAFMMACGIIICELDPNSYGWFFSMLLLVIPFTLVSAFLFMAWTQSICVLFGAYCCERTYDQECRKTYPIQRRR